MAPLFRTRDYRRKQDPRLYTVGWCPSCRYGRVDHRLDAASVAQFYQVPYYTHEDFRPTDARLGFWAKARGHLAWRADRGNPLQPDEAVGSRVLDIGCGCGVNLSRFRAHGMAVTGVEPDAAARRTARAHGVVHGGTAEALPDEVLGHAFDTVLLVHVLEHCIEPEAALLNARQLLAPRGRLIIEVPNSAAAGFRAYRQFWPWTDVPRHLHFFTRWSLHALLARCGLEVERTLYVGYCRQFQAEWIRTQDLIATELENAPPRVTKAWLHLARTALAASDDKYDSVRVHARLAPAAPAMETASSR